MLTSSVFRSASAGWHLSQKYHFYHAMQESDRLGPRVLLPALMMRHTGDMRVGTEQVLTLPPKREATLLVTLSTPERAAYDAAHATMQGRWRQLADEGHAAVSKNLLLAMSFLTPVRLLCSGGSFSAADLAAKRLMADEEPAVQGRGACPACGLEPECGVASPCCGAWACYDCIADVAHRGHACAACAKAVPLAALPPRPDHADNAADAASSVLMESKLHALLAELERLRSEDPSAKSLVFSSFTASLTWLAAKLKDRGFTHATITGSMSLNQRAKALEAFQSAPPTTIFLLSLRAGAVGLNLTAASQVFLLEPCFNPAMEEQAIGRVHRMGQTRPTVVRRLIVRDSLEERIRACVERRVAGGGARFCEAESSLKVGSVAGGLREDKAALRYDELSHLFGC
jgi:SNF2 family DNA or RNA helicase